MTVISPGHEAQLKHEMARCENLVKRLEGVLTDTMALEDDVLRETVTDCLQTAMHALRNECWAMQYKLVHPLPEEGEQP